MTLSRPPVKRGPNKISVKKLKALGGVLPWSTIQKRGGPIRKVNPTTSAKRKQRQRTKHAAYMRSETRRIVDARAGGQCEAWVAVDCQEPDRSTVHPRASDARRHRGKYVVHVRCAAPGTDHHHLTYARYGGKELPSDMLKCCERCHDYLEAQHPTRRHGR